MTMEWPASTGVENLEQHADVVEMQTSGGFVEKNKRVAAFVTNAPIF